MQNKNTVKVPRCRFCSSTLKQTFVDLGMSPLCQDHVKPEELNQMEPFYPLHAYVCENCFLVQLEEYVSPSVIFNDYAYFSSYSDTWLKHARDYTELMIDRYKINSKSFVVEIASNDGYLLQYFVKKGIPVLGVEPAPNVAEYAIKAGINTLVRYFGKNTAVEISSTHGNADLILGNNVLAHVPDINDFVSGMKILLKPNGVITMEFPHLLKLIEENQFDTIYHEHFSYLSLLTVLKIFDYHGLSVFDVDELTTHGGSLRIYAKHKDDGTRQISEKIEILKEREISVGLNQLEFYSSFTKKVKETKWKILEFLINTKKTGKSIVGYGAPGKGNTLLNYCGIRNDFLDYTVDRNPHKQGNYLPGTLIPIYHPDKIKETKPDYVFILPWNLKAEIMNQLCFVRTWGCKFIVPIPELRVFG